MIALIMAGGIGSRFWPLSRKTLPKQYLNITSDKSMIRTTAERLLPRIDWEDIHVVTSADQVRLVKNNLPELPLNNIIVEPFGRNTAPCIALSTYCLEKRYAGDEVMIVLPADHDISDQKSFLDSLDVAESAAKKENLVTFGIEPDYPATGYGYIEKGELYETGMFHVKQFKEKPDRETAENFIASGQYLWNSGMFAWRIDTIRKQFRALLPRIDELLHMIQERRDNGCFNIDEIYEQMPKIPIDIGIMEQAQNRIVIPISIGWSDVGGWRALFEISDKDENGNVIIGENVMLDTNDCYIRSKKLVATIDLSGLAIIDTDDVILISKMDSTERVKELREKLDHGASSKYL